MKIAAFLLLLAFVINSEMQAHTSREWQYKSGLIEIPAATPDEPVAIFGPRSIDAAAEYLTKGPSRGLVSVPASPATQRVFTWPNVLR